MTFCGLVLRQAASLAIGGVALGLVIAFGWREVEEPVYNVSPIDPVTFVSVVTMVIAIALFACYLPARRAAKASPMIALRTE
jgi:ABC-type antimicrobial peptide transport system permease subunit